MNTFSEMACMRPVAIILFLIPLLAVAAAGQSSPSPVRVMQAPPTGSQSDLYVFNRPPLLASPFAKLPVGSITPKGWLRGQLELEAAGMIGHLEELSNWCKFEGSAWASPEGKGHSPWEELPYWLRGYGDLGYVLKDADIAAKARRWLDKVLASQMADGWFGPRELKASEAGKPDVWPHMLMLNALQSFYEATGDERVLPFMTKFAHWELELPEQDLLSRSWQKVRAGDNLETIYWLYNHTGDAWLLDAAKKVHARTENWTAGIRSYHGVNFAQCFRQPAIFYLQTGDARYLQAAERNYKTMMDQYGQVPGGMYGADENARPGFGDPRQGAETCAMVEYMHSFEMLTRITGNPAWADRCEEVAFNSLPAALTPDFKGLHYITSPNVIQLDRQNKSPGLQNGGELLSYSPFEQYRCCQHNVSMGWPYYAEELWLATADRGLCASLYAASEVSAKVGDGTVVRIAEETDYPFADAVTLKLSVPKAVKFPLYLRVPRWCQRAQVQINSQPADVKAEPLAYVVIDRSWADGDTVTFRMPMNVNVRTWPKNHDSVSVDYGPLTFSLKIGEKWTAFGARNGWSQYEVFPTTPWNYGLVLDEQNPAGSFEVHRKAGPPATQPFTPDSAPIELTVKARRIPAWQADRLNLVGLLQPSPANTTEPEETVTLIPMGAARLRISAFPTAVTEGGHAWAATQP